MCGAGPASYQLYFMFLATCCPHASANYDIIVRRVGCLNMLFLSTMRIFRWGDVDPEDGLRQNELNGSEICDQ